MKILILGYARHGKDTVAEIIKKLYGLNFESSSQAALRIFLFDILNDKYNLDYKTQKEAFEDRVNHRDKWYNEIIAYTKKSPNKLTKEILKNNDIYVGMRSINELNDAKKNNMFDLYLGVYDYRKPIESDESNSINVFEDSDIVIMNNGSIEDLRKSVKLLNIK